MTSSASPRKTAFRLVRWLIVAVAAVLLLPYLLAPLYRVIDPVSTLMLGRWILGKRVERTIVPLDADRAGPAAHGDRLRGRPVLHPSRHRSGRNARGDRRRRGHHRRRGAARPSPSRSPRTCSCGRAAASSARGWSSRWRSGSTWCCPSGGSWKSISTSPNGARTANSASRPAPGRPSTSRPRSCPPARRRCSPRCCPIPKRRSAKQPRPGVRRIAGIVQARAARAGSIDACLQAP